LIDSESNETIDVINPATEEVIGKVAKGNEKDVEKSSSCFLSSTELWRNSKYTS
jgi:acyl-CoA reductase-like NAD-dependent aldehyde dehydrogenase